MDDSAITGVRRFRPLLRDMWYAIGASPAGLHLGEVGTPRRWAALTALRGARVCMALAWTWDTPSAVTVVPVPFSAPAFPRRSWRWCTATATPWC